MWEYTSVSGHTFTVEEVENTTLGLLSVWPLFMTVYHPRGPDTEGRGLGYNAWYCHDPGTAQQQ